MVLLVWMVSIPILVNVLMVIEGKIVEKVNPVTLAVSEDAIRWHFQIDVGLEPNPFSPALLCQGLGASPVIPLPRNDHLQIITTTTYKPAPSQTPSSPPRPDSIIQTNNI